MVNPYYQDSAVTIYHGDCREIVPQLGRFDLLLTDPPYGLGNKHNGGGKGKSTWKNLPSVAKAFDMQRPEKATFDLLLSVSNNQIIWGGNYFADLFPPRMCWLVWDKDLHGFTTSDFEMAWTSYNKAARRFVYCCSNNRGFAPGMTEPKGLANVHPTQKPLSLMLWCISIAGDVQTILDPFAGSGTTGRAAKDFNKKAVLIEKEERYCEIAASRMSQ